MTTRVTVAPPQYVPFAKVVKGDVISYVAGGFSQDFHVNGTETIEVMEDPDHQES